MVSVMYVSMTLLISFPRIILWIIFSSKKLTIIRELALNPENATYGQEMEKEEIKERFSN